MAGAGSLLLALPDPCLLRVLQCCAADDHRSLFSAARSHSRLHQAAVVALRSITQDVSQQQQMDGVIVYLGKHGQHVNSLELTSGKHFANPQVSVRQLPPQLQLSSLQLHSLNLQLQPGTGSQGVLGAAAAAALKQLQLTYCRVLDDRPAGALAAALSQLPAGLEHLSISDMRLGVRFPADVLHRLQRLQHLTYLELGEAVDGNNYSPDLQPLQALTGLVGLKLEHMQLVISSSMLLGMQRLTRLELSLGMELEPGALAGMTKLKHLCLRSCRILGGAAGAAQLLSHLQPLQQLTHLSLDGSLWTVEGSIPPASAHAALTASSKLQHLDVSHCTLPADVWQHVFPAGRQLPSLKSLAMAQTSLPSVEYTHCLEGSRLVSCCPGLQSLDMGSLHCSVQLLAPLQGLSGLQTLRCGWETVTTEVVQAVCQLTAVRELNVWSPWGMKEEGLLLHLTQLRQLTVLRYWTGAESAFDRISLSGVDEPVWRQLARLHLDHPNPGVAQQAAAALAGSQ